MAVKVCAQCGYVGKIGKESMCPACQMSLEEVHDTCGQPMSKCICDKEGAEAVCMGCDNGETSCNC